LFEEQMQISERLREQAYKEPVTQLGNRRYFDLQLDYLLKNEEKLATAILLLIELKQFKEYNEQYGYEAGDALLKNVAAVVSQSIVPFENAIAANKGASFFIILPNVTKVVGEQVADKICLQFKEFEIKGLSKVKEVGNI